MPAFLVDQRETSVYSPRAEHRCRVFLIYNVLKTTKKSHQYCRFGGYSLIRTDEGGVSVTVCQDKAGTDESLQVARNWIQENASNLGTSPPSVSEGSIILHLG